MDEENGRCAPVLLCQLVDSSSGFRAWENADELAADMLLRLEHGRVPLTTLEASLNLSEFIVACCGRCRAGVQKIGGLIYDQEPSIPANVG